LERQNILNKTIKRKTQWEIKQFLSTQKKVEIRTLERRGCCNDMTESHFLEDLLLFQWEQDSTGIRMIYSELRFECEVD